jgi:DNA topoisomerase-6 subunit B
VCPGIVAKSLFTTIREFVENSLDAAESANILPDVEVSITEYLEEEHNIRHNIVRRQPSSSAASASSSSSSKKKKKGDEEDSSDDDDGNAAPAPPPAKKAKGKGAAKDEPIAIAVNSGQAQNIHTRGEQKYYLISCKDNGCGMPGNQIGESFGRVLSGSKHGIKQTRGKYGLGAKMVSYHNNH